MSRAVQDPQHIHLAARIVAELVADGTVTFSAAVGVCMRAALRLTSAPDGLEDRIGDTICQATAVIARADASAIRSASRSMIRLRQSRMVVEAVAEVENARLGYPLTTDVVHAIAASEARRAVQRRAA